MGKASRFLGEYIENQWRKIAQKESSQTVEDLVRLLWEEWDAAEFTIEEIENGLKVTCTRCPIADNYHTISEPVYVSVFHCISDPFICRGFNSKIKHHKTKSYMNGDAFCDHHYTLDK